MIPTFPTYVFIDDTGIQRVMQSNVKRSEMEIGAQKTRPIQSVPMFQMSLTISISINRLSSWQDFFINQIKSGAYWFLLFDPIDGVKKRFRFVEYEINWTKRGNILQTSIVLESYDGI